jgi:hypothetical protein
MADGLFGTYLKARQGELIDAKQLQQLRHLQTEYDRLQQVKVEAGHHALTLAAAPVAEAPALSWDKPETWKPLTETSVEHQKEIIKLASAQTKELCKNRLCPTLIPILERAVQLAADGVAELEQGGAEPDQVAQARADWGEIKKRYAAVRSYKTLSSPRQLLGGIVPL